ncbi:uncharacterized protein [Patagioenas fasciata]|uniref:uncharacterized protein n=1 Tax=Patagioenas fasciata TaxID=372321 RepID=UPI003A992823
MDVQGSACPGALELCLATSLAGTRPPAPATPGHADVAAVQRETAAVQRETAAVQRETAAVPARFGSPEEISCANCDEEQFISNFTAASNQESALPAHGHATSRRFRCSGNLSTLSVCAGPHARVASEGPLPQWCSPSRPQLCVINFSEAHLDDPSSIQSHPDSRRLSQVAAELSLLSVTAAGRLQQGQDENPFVSAVAWLGHGHNRHRTSVSAVTWLSGRHNRHRTSVSAVAWLSNGHNRHRTSVSAAWLSGRHNRHCTSVSAVTWLSGGHNRHRTSVSAVTWLSGRHNHHRTSVSAVTWLSGRHNRHRTSVSAVAWLSNGHNRHRTSVSAVTWLSGRHNHHRTSVSAVTWLSGRHNRHRTSVSAVAWLSGRHNRHRTSVSAVTWLSGRHNRHRTSVSAVAWLSGRHNHHRTALRAPSPRCATAGQRPAAVPPCSRSGCDARRESAPGCAGGRTEV